MVGTMEPVFDNQGGALGIGDIAISKSKPNILWAGTGENNLPGTYAGTGVYKTTDAETLEIVDPRVRNI